MELESQLQSLGYEVTSIVNTGEKAIEKAETDKPDLILMDIRIKGEMDGIDTAEVIRNKFGIPVIFSTAYLDQERIERAKITMPFGYVLKPIQERDLKVTIEMALYISKIDKERRLTEIRLKKNEKKYRSLFNSINDGFCLHELVYDQTGKAIDYKVIDVNPRYEEILKIKKEDVIDIMASIIYEAEIPPYLDVYTEVAETGEPCRFETFYPPMKKHFLISVFSYEKGKFVTVFQDITDRKSSEEELRKREEWFSTTLRSIGDAVITTDKKSVITSLNPVAEALTGWKQEEAKGKPLLEIFNVINEETRKPVENPVQKVLKEDRIVGLANHTILIAKDGTEIPVDDSGSPIRNEQGEVYGVVLVFRDIIERKKSEEALRDSEEKHRILFETMMLGVVYQNAEGIITDANPAAERILGLSLSQLQGKTSMDPRWKAIHEDGSDFPGDTHAISVALRTGKTIQNVIQGVFHPEKKEYRWISVNAVPKFRKGESTPYEAYAIFDDITELKTEKK
jgi:PAS domain S-box-containing protein